MEDLLRLPSPSTSTFLPFPTATPRRLRRSALPPAARFSATVASPPRPHQELDATTSVKSPFHDSSLLLGVDLLDATPADVRSIVQILRSVGLPPPEIRRTVGICPEILSAGNSAVAAALVFLIREAGVPPDELPRAIHQRPRLLASNVADRLRPTLRFFQSLGVRDTSRNSSLLCLGVEENLLPRLEFLKGIGFAPRDAQAMAGRFPNIFRYSVEENLEPKFDFFSMEMERDLRELRDFPEYFSYSLDERIRPRHRLCKERGMGSLPLPAMLRPNEREFLVRLEVCTGSSPPLMSSPLSARRLGDGRPGRGSPA